MRDAAACRDAEPNREAGVVSRPAHQPVASKPLARYRLSQSRIVCAATPVRALPGMVQGRSTVSRGRCHRFGSQALFGEYLRFYVAINKASHRRHRQPSRSSTALRIAALRIAAQRLRCRLA